MVDLMEINAEIMNLDSPVSDKKKNEFKDHLMESIEEVLSFSQVVLNFLELNTAFKKEEIVDNPKIFCDELEDLFGASASGIEDLIINRLYSKINMKYRKERGKGFERYLREAFSRYMGPY